MSFTSKQLLKVARDALAGSRPSDAHIARSISSAYYATFHHFIDASADQFVGRARSRLTRARAHYCRSVDHNILSKRCKAAQNQSLQFPVGIMKYAAGIYEMRETRHKADYDRTVFFTHADAAQCIADVERRITAFDAAPKYDRIAFLIWANFEKRDH